MAQAPSLFFPAPPPAHNRFYLFLRGNRVVGNAPDHQNHRQAMYSLIHFSVLDQDIEIPEELKKHIIANPDVEHHNSYATFTINGEKKDCYLVFLASSVFEKPGDNFFSGMYSGVVPMDGTCVYLTDEVDDFWDIVGRNTSYAEDPEETMATNFSYAIVHLDDGYSTYATPSLLEDIVDCLKSLGSKAD